MLRAKRPADLELKACTNPFAVNQPSGKPVFTFEELIATPSTPFLDPYGMEVQSAQTKEISSEFQQITAQDLSFYFEPHTTEPHASGLNTCEPHAIEPHPDQFAALQTQDFYNNFYINDDPSTDFSMHQEPSEVHAMGAFASGPAEPLWIPSQDSAMSSPEFSDFMDVSTECSTYQQQPHEWIYADIYTGQLTPPLAVPEPSTVTQQSTEFVQPPADSPVFLSPEETQKREQSLKRVMQSANLSDFQKKYIFNHDFRMNPHMANKNSKKCTTCKSTFSNTGRHAYHYQDHGVKENNKGEKRELCPEKNCPMSAIGFCTRQSVIRHLKSVHGNIRHKCSRCNRIFSRRDGLTRHFESSICMGSKNAAKQKKELPTKRDLWEYFEQNLIMPL